MFNIITVKKFTFKKLFALYGSILIALFVVNILHLYSFNISYFNVIKVVYKSQLSTFDTNKEANLSLNIVYIKNNTKVNHFTLCPVGSVIVKYITIFSNSFAKQIDITKFKYHPNLPFFLRKPGFISELIPDLNRIRWTGVIWQESWRNYPKFILYSAHFDNREQLLNISEDHNNIYVRILALYDGDEEPVTYSCQFWFNQEDQPFLTEVHRYDVLDYQGFASKNLIPYMITCIVPRMDNQLKAPIAVSIVNNSCISPSNILQVTGLPPEGNSTSKSSNSSEYPSVGICGPALYYYSEDFSHRLIEWFEIMHVIGASKIIFYKSVTHENVEKVLKYYEEIGRLIIVSFHYPPPYPDHPLLKRPWTMIERGNLYALENIYFTDCILRFKDDFDYLAHFDPDEIPILKKHKSFGQLIKYLRNNGPKDYVPAYYHLEWETFYPKTPPGRSMMNISERFYILRHNRRPTTIKKLEDYNGKSIYDTSRVLAVFSHEPLLYVDKRNNLRKDYVVDKALAYTAHFRSSECGSRCNNVSYLEENFLVPYKEKIIKEVNIVLKRLNLKLQD